MKKLALVLTILTVFTCNSYAQVSENPSYNKESPETASAGEFAEMITSNGGGAGTVTIPNPIGPNITFPVFICSDGGIVAPIRKPRQCRIACGRTESCLKCCEWMYRGINSNATNSIDNLGTSSGLSFCKIYCTINPFNLD